jgi:hypothetical protein
MKPETKDLVFIAVILIGITLIFLAGGIALKEFRKAETFCNSINGNYTLKYPRHFCDGKRIVQYEDGWAYEINYKLNLSDLIINP